MRGLFLAGTTRLHFSEWVSKWVSEWVWVSEWMSKWASESEWVNNWVGWWVSEWISEWVSKEASKWVPAHQAVSLSFSQPASQPASQSVRNLVSLQPTLLYRKHIYSLGVQLKLSLQLKLLLDVASYTNMLPYLYIAATFTTKNRLRGEKSIYSTNKAWWKKCFLSPSLKKNTPSE